MAAGALVPDLFQPVSMGVPSIPLAEMKWILAIDPGPIESTYVLLGNQIIENKTVNNIQMNDVLEGLAAGGMKVEVICEEVASFGMPVGKAVFDTCRWEGEFRCLCRERGIPFYSVTRTTIKIFWCNSVRAKDANIRQRLLDFYGPPGTKKAPGPTYGISKHAWSALAIAGYRREMQGRHE
jgi:hypothetical protein